MITIETIFQNGAFRPLSPVTIPENRRVKISLEHSTTNDTGLLNFPRHTPQAYPDDFSESSEEEFDYNSVPPKSVRTVKAHLVFA